MRIVIVLVCLVCALCISSCVPLNKITYLQEKEGEGQDSLLVAQQLSPPYRLQIYDLLNIDIRTVDIESSNYFSKSSGNQQNQAQMMQNPAGLYFNGYTIDQRGEIEIPDLGKVKAVGLTTSELKQKIEKKLYDEVLYEETANLYVSVNLAGINYTLVGEVNQPGLQTIFREKANIVEAVSSGGGVPITGNLSDVKLIRKYPDGVKVHHLDLTDIKLVNSPFYLIQPNDMIVVDPLPQKTLGTGTTGLQSFSTFLTIVTGISTIVLILSR